MIGLASAVLLGLILIVRSVHELPQRAVYNNECQGVYVPGPKGEEIKSCSWLAKHPGPTDKDMPVGPGWRARHPPED